MSLVIQLPAGSYQQELAMLSDTKIRSAKPGEKPCKLTDEKAMHLLVMPNGSKLWRFAYRYGDKQKLISLGAYPEVSLAAARERRDEARKLLAAGIDPSAKRKAEKLAQADTFKAVAEEFLASRKDTLTPAHHARVRARIARFYPVVGDKPVGAITATDLLPVLQAIERAGMGETAARARTDAGKVLRYAVATGRATHDPTAALRGALAPVKGGHHAAVTEPKAFGALLRAIDGYEGEPVTRAALRLLPLVFVRPGELRHAQWSEIDLDAATWAIPAAKMKMKHDHIVPLSTQAVAILRELHPLTGRRFYVFPSLRTRDRPMSENTINAALRRLGYDKKTMTGHGFRASARTLLDEVLGMRVDLIEHQLAHAVKDPLGRAYNRTAHLPERVKMMQKWADYCDGLKAGADVVPIRQAAQA
jgi:integrase